jgi:prefoldin subunit 5
MTSTTTTLLIIAAIVIGLGLIGLTICFIAWLVRKNKAKKAKAIITNPSEENAEDNAEETNSEESQAITPAPVCNCTEAGANKTAEEAQQTANACLEEIEKMKHAQRLNANANAIRTKEAELALKESELASKKEKLHFLKYDNGLFVTAASKANTGLLNATSTKSNAYSKWKQAVEAKNAAEVEVANVTLDGGDADALDAVNQKLNAAIASVEAAFAELQSAISAMKAAEKAKADADANVEANKTAIAETESEIKDMQSEIESLKKEIETLKA